MSQTEHKGIIVTARDLSLLRLFVMLRVLDATEIMTIGAFPALRRTNRSYRRVGDRGLRGTALRQRVARAVGGSAGGFAPGNRGCG